MKVATKGLLLVSVPLSMQLILIVTLSVLLWQAHNQAAYESNAKEVVANCNSLLLHLTTVVKHNYGLDSGDKSFTAEDVALLNQDVEAVRQALSAEKQQNDAMQQLSRRTAQFIPFLGRVNNREMEVNGSGYRSERQLYVELDHFYDNVNSIINSVESVHANDPEERMRAANSIKVALIFFVISSVILTLALAYFASISIRKPLELMAKNADRISQRLPLESELGGSDELADLDRLLHAVDESIDSALTSERNLISNAADLVCSIDQNGFFLSANPYAQVLLGYSPEYLVGGSVLDVVVSDDCDKVDQLIAARSITNDTTTVEVKMRTSDKKILETSWSAIWSEQDRSLFCVIHDITERKNLERLKQDFIAMISHDLRTPLMSVHSSFELVTSGATGELSQTADYQLGSATRNTEHLIDLVNDLLDFEKLEAGRMDFDTTRISSKVVVEETLQLVKALSDQMQVQITAPYKEFFAECDHRKIVQVMVNLISNALKHSPKNGEVRITIDPVEDSLLFKVHDQGPGVPEEYRESIFAPFEQISHRATAALGTGLGLAICRLIIEGQGGKIGVTSSDVLSGSCFYFSVRRSV